MKETRMPPAYAANLVANNGNIIYEAYSIDGHIAEFSMCENHHWFR